MSYRFRKKSLAREVERVAREELEGTLKEILTVADQSRSTAVHKARKHLKKLRALLRLLRPATDRPFTNAKTRRCATRLSECRQSATRMCGCKQSKNLIFQSRRRRPPMAISRIQAAMGARLGKAVEEGEKNDWSKEAPPRSKPRFVGSRSGHRNDSYRNPCRVD